MKSLFIFLTLLVFRLSLIAAITSHETEMLKDFAEEIHPQMAAIWNTYLSNFDKRIIKSWNYSKVNKNFTIELEEPLKLWVESSSKGDEPKKGSILILGETNRMGKTLVEGFLKKDQKTIEFKKGFSIYCKYTMGFVTLPITAQVYNFIYQNEENIFLEAGKSGLTQKRKKSVKEFLKAWNYPEGVVEGDHVSFLKNKE